MFLALFEAWEVSDFNQLGAAGRREGGRGRLNIIGVYGILNARKTSPVESPLFTHVETKPATKVFAAQLKESVSQIQFYQDRS